MLVLTKIFKMNFLTIGFLIVAHIACIHAMDGYATYYDVGMTACGQTYSDNDMVAAIAMGYWSDPNPNNDQMCQKTATVTDPSSGKSVWVRIKDECERCQMGDIDLSPAAFQQLQSLDVGRFPIRWDFN